MPRRALAVTPLALLVYLSLSVYQAEVPADIVSPVILRHTENVFSTVRLLHILRENDF
jgi:hypothetical protein